MVEAPADFTTAPYVSDNVMLMVATANLELLEIMSKAREKMYLASTLTQEKGPTVVASGPAR